ncbi:hypothetical protein [Telluribacter humicola]|uniref:hypothetical protein n=1 Tax=Telluribacter humicola TaxID=1720261 RepID=UPI001E2B7967|nr:hypothetical protein [Telluribacter humicola]
MSNNSAFYKALFQYDTLFRVEEDLSMLKVPSLPAEPERDLTPAPPVEAISVEAPGVETPGVETPGVETPGVETPGVEAPGVETSQVATSQAEMSGVGTPRVDAPRVEVPQVVSLNVEAPVEAKAPAMAPPQPVAPPPPVVTVPTVPFPALKHKVLVLVDEPNQPDMLPSEYILLSNILKAVGHSIDEADIVNLSYIPSADARSVFADKLTNHFITFGVPLIKLQLDLLLPPYTPKQVEGIWFLLADPLAVIDADKALKKRLWLALQKMFAVS